MIKSPFNYTGGKYALLDQILPLFPKEIDSFYDLFGGGADVSINVKANKILCNDIVPQMIELYQYIQQNDVHIIIDEIYKTIIKYDIGKPKELKKNVFTKKIVESLKKKFVVLRDYYDENPNPKDFFVLMTHAFNNLIKFNKNDGYSVGYGNRTFTTTHANRLISFKNKSQNFTFTNKSYEEIEIDDNSFVYCDPPYLITAAHYNSFWKEKEEIALLEYLDDLDKRNIKFALSNVTTHKGLTNTLLVDWSEKYYTHELQKSYNSCSPNKRNLHLPTQEVLITNYKIERKLDHFLVM